MGSRALLFAFVVLTGCVATRPEIASRVAAVDEARLRRHVETLAGFGPRHASQTESVAKTLEYLTRELESYGYTVEREPFEAFVSGVERHVDDAGRITWKSLPGNMREHFNLLATRRGSVRPDEIIEVSAHYDTVVFSPGADDNASGVAGVLETARLAAQLPLERTLRLCLFGMEEDGLIGSRAHVDRILENPSETVVALVNLEMIGYASDEPGSQDAPLRIPLIAAMPREGNFILVAGAWATGWLGNVFEGCARRYVPELRYYSANRIAAWFPDAYRSDHAGYWEAGIPAIMVADTANFRNPHYHLASDVPETLNYRFLGNVTRAALATTLELSGIAR